MYCASSHSIWVARRSEIETQKKTQALGGRALGKNRDDKRPLVYKR